MANTTVHYEGGTPTSNGSDVDHVEVARARMKSQYVKVCMLQLRAPHAVTHRAPPRQYY